jgi:glutathione synthase
MNLAFLIDPPESLHIEKDTSFALMLEAQRQGHAVYILTRGSITLDDGKVIIQAQRAAVSDNIGHPFDLQLVERLEAGFFDILFIRTDPPFDSHYLTDTWLLSQVGKKPLVLNSPNGLRTINEKIWAAQFTDLIPKTLVTADQHEYERFLDFHQTVVIKPTDGFGGSAVFLVKAGDSNAAVTFETLKKLGGYVIVQQYLPAAKEGDKRLLVLEGELLGAVLRHHSGGDHRNNFAAGGKAQQIDVTADDLRMLNQLKPYLLEHGIFFAGIDIIGGKLIEVNVTSPTCLREMQQFYPENLAEKIINAAVGRAHKIVEHS